MPASEIQEPLCGDPRLPSIFDVEAELHEQVDEQPYVVEQDGEAEVEQPDDELLGRGPREEVLDRLVAVLDAPATTVSVYPAFCLSAIEITGDGCLMRARFPDRTTLAEYREAWDDRGMSFDLEGLYQPTADREGERLTLAGLTPKQREAVLLAHEEGYYDLPRGTNLTDLSDRLDISRRSLSDRLRRAERGIITTAITNDRLAPRDNSAIRTQ